MIVDLKLGKLRKSIKMNKSLIFVTKLISNSKITLKRVPGLKHFDNL